MALRLRVRRLTALRRWMMSLRHWRRCGEGTRHCEPAYTSEIYTLPRWEQEHGIHLELRQGRLDFQE